MVELYKSDCNDIIADIVTNSKNPVIVSDPPFNIGYKYNTYHDRMDEGEYYSFMGSIFSLCPSVIIHYPEPLFKLSIQMNTPPTKVVSWIYNSNTPRQHRDIGFFRITPDFKRVRQAYKNPNDKRIKERMAKGKTGGRLYDWWNINQVKNTSKDKTSHPCQMPVEIMRNIIGILPDNITVIDPFMGAGTTGVACKELGRDFIGIEMDEEYFKIAQERLCNIKAKEV